MKVTTETGAILDTNGGLSENATNYARGKGMKNLVVCLATHPNGMKEYVILEVDKGVSLPIYSNQSFESICCRIDIMVLREDIKEFTDDTQTP
jgi:hypothetical protein